MQIAHALATVHFRLVLQWFYDRRVSLPMARNSADAKRNKTIIKTMEIDHDIGNVNISLVLQWFCNRAF